MNCTCPSPTHQLKQQLHKYNTMSPTPMVLQARKIIQQQLATAIRWQDHKCFECEGKIPAGL